MALNRLSIVKLAAALAITTFGCAFPADAAKGPVINNISPSSVIAGGSGFTLTVNGSGFNGNSSVLWNGSPRPTVTINGTRLLAFISSADIATVGTVQITVVDPKPTPQQSNSFTLTIQAVPLTITTSSLPTAIVQEVYIAAVGKSGGVSPYSWKLTSGQLPPGLALDSTSGAVWGTPGQTGKYDFTAQVTDSSLTPQTASQTLAVSVAASSPLSITTTTLPNGTVQAAYGATLAATGGTSPYSWSVTAGSLPPGLTISASTGAITGTPTTSGSYSFTVQVKDSAATPQSAMQSFTVGVAAAALQITTTSLPSGQVQVAYSSTLAATGGTTPYSWSVVSGSLPLGLSLNASTGAITGMPTQSGTFTFTIKVADSSSQSSQAALSIAIASATSTVQPLAITTTALPQASTGQPYSVTLLATGGTPGYTWSITSGQLPSGLTLGAARGQISGTPSQIGQFSFTVQVADSGSPQQTATKSFTMSVASIALDQYGGLVSLPSPNPSTGYFRVEKFGSRWMFVTPANNAFWLLGVYVVTPSGDIDDLGNSYYNRAVVKYGDADLIWGPQQNRRITSWGFNTINTYSSTYTLATHSESFYWPGDHTQPVKMPFIALVRPAYYSLKNLNNWANQPVKDIMAGTDSHYGGYRANVADYFDANLDMWLNNALLNDPSYIEIRNSLYNNYMVGMLVDDGDQMYGFGAGPDLPTNPPGHNNTHLGWIVLITSPTQTSNSSLGVTYTDTKVYTKYALRDYLAQKYGTIVALNTAWGSSYTTFDSAGGWGVGTGLLDENGRNSWVSTTDYVKLSNLNANLKADLDTFLGQMAAKYFSICRTRIKQYFPNHLYLGPDTLGTWGAPSAKPVLQAAAQYIDVMAIGGGFDPTQAQAILDYVAQNYGDKPFLVATFLKANPDSALWRYTQADAFASQASRGLAFYNQLTAFSSLSNSAGVKPIIGSSWWQFLDNWGEKSDWGFVSFSDNVYDSKEAVIALGKDPWGYSTGGEERNYGDVLTPIKNAISAVLQTIMAGH